MKISDKTIQLSALFQFQMGRSQHFELSDPRSLVAFVTSGGFGFQNTFITGILLRFFGGCVENLGVQQWVRGKPGSSTAKPLICPVFTQTHQIDATVWNISRHYQYLTCCLLI